MTLSTAGEADKNSVIDKEEKRMLMELGVGLAMAVSAVTDTVLEGIIGSLETAEDTLKYGPADALKIRFSDCPEAKRVEVAGQRCLQTIEEVFGTDAEEQNDDGRRKDPWVSFSACNSFLRNFSEPFIELGVIERDDSHSEELYGQLMELAEGLHEYLSEFLEETAERYGEEEILSDREELPEPDASDYGSGSYDYERMSQAKVACKEALMRAINEMRKSYEEEKAQAAKQCEEFLARLGKDIREFANGYQASFDDYVSLYCEGEAKAHAMERREELIGAGEMTQWYPDEKVKEQLAAILEEEFEEKAKALWNVKPYFSDCDYDEEDELYCYEMEDALSTLYDAVSESLEAACEKTEERLQELYMSVLDRMANDLSDGLVSLVKTAETEKETDELEKVQ